MSKRFSILLVILTIVSGLIGGIISERIFTPKVAIAQESELGSKIGQLESGIRQLEKRINQIEVDIEMNLNQILQRQIAEKKGTSETKYYPDPKTGRMFAYIEYSDKIVWHKQKGNTLDPDTNWEYVPMDKVPEYVIKAFKNGQSKEEQNLLEPYIPANIPKTQMGYIDINGDFWTRHRVGDPWQNQKTQRMLAEGSESPDLYAWKTKMDPNYKNIIPLKKGGTTVWYDTTTKETYDRAPFNPSGGQKALDSSRTPGEK